MHLVVSSYHVTYAFQNEFTLYSCLNIMELLAQIRRKILSLNGYNWTQKQNYLFHQLTLNHMAQLTK